MSYQKIILVGNLGRDPEMKYLPNGGQAVTNFSMATNRQYNNSNNEKVKETVWWRLTAWGRTAEIANQYVRSGQEVMVECRMNPDRETGGPRIFQRNDGTWGAAYEATIERLILLSNRSSGSTTLPSEQEFQSGDEEEVLF